MKHTPRLLPSAPLSDDDRAALERYIACTLSRPLLTAEQERTATPDELIEHNIRLSVAVALRYAGRGVPLDDLIQEGNIGLIRAASDYDAARGRFSTYATYWVRQAIRRCIHNAGATIRLPVHVQEQQTTPPMRMVPLDARHDQAPAIADQLAAPDDTEQLAIDAITYHQLVDTFQIALATLAEYERDAAIRHLVHRQSPAHIAAARGLASAHSARTMTYYAMRVLRARMRALMEEAA